MDQNGLKLTTAQFARLHRVNKRTLHYYDQIGLFSPRCKGENGYRYYDYAQSADFEYIRMLKELHLSLEEIKAFLGTFEEQKFLDLMLGKEEEIDAEIQKLKRVKALLAQKRQHLLLCKTIDDLKVETAELKEEYLLTAPYRFEDDDAARAFQYIQSVWSPEQYRAGVGSYISLEKLRAGRFDCYDGLYVFAAGRQKKEGALLKPRGTYLCGYLKGTWDRLPELYEKMFAYARRHRLSLTGYAFERGINDFMVASSEEYITQVTIKTE